MIVTLFQTLEDLKWRCFQSRKSYGPWENSSWLRDPSAPSANDLEQSAVLLWAYFAFTFLECRCERKPPAPTPAFSELKQAQRGPVKLYGQSLAFAKGPVDDGVINTMDMYLSKLQEIVKDREAWRAAVHGVTGLQRVWHDLVTEQQGPYSRFSLDLNFKLLSFCTFFNNAWTWYFQTYCGFAVWKSDPS